MKQHDVDLVVIGSGLAGMSAAMEAANKGLHCVVVEERPYVGGRARSFIDKVTGTEIDNGQHLLMGCYHRVLGMLEMLGTRQYIRIQPALRVRFVQVLPGGDIVHDVLDSSLAPGSAGVAFGILRLTSVSMRSRLAALRFARKVMQGKVDASGKTCREVFEAEGQRADIVNLLWEPIVLATLNATVEQADAELLLTVMKRAFFGRQKHDSKLAMPTVGLSTLWKPFEEWMSAHRGKVLTSVAADRLTIGDTSSEVHVQLSNGEVITSRYVVVATTQRAAQRLLVDSGIDINPVIDVIPVSPIVNVYLWFESYAWLSDPIVSMIGATVQWLFKQQRQGLVAVTISAGKDVVGMTSEDIRDLCIYEIRQAFPESTDVNLIHYVVIKEKQATPLFTPGNAALRPAAAILGDRIALAGDWTDNGLPATLEGAAQSGLNAIRALGL